MGVVGALRIPSNHGALALLQGFIQFIGLFQGTYMPLLKACLNAKCGVCILYIL